MCVAIHGFGYLQSLSMASLLNQQFVCVEQFVGRHRLRNNHKVLSMELCVSRTSFLDNVHQGIVCTALEVVNVCDRTATELEKMPCTNSPNLVMLHNVQ